MKTDIRPRLHPPLVPLPLDNTSRDLDRPALNVVCFECGERVRTGGGIQVRANHGRLLVIIHPECI